MWRKKRNSLRVYLVWGQNGGQNFNMYIFTQVRQEMTKGASHSLEKAFQTKMISWVLDVITSQKCELFIIAIGCVQFLKVWTIYNR